MKRNWIKLYSTYSKNYDKKAIKSKVGFEDKYTLNEFKTMYTAIENERKLQVKHGERKVLIKLIIKYYLLCFFIQSQHINF